MTYLNPEIFPDDWAALFLEEDDCCEENRRNIRQLWLRLLSANRISTQNDAQLQNSQIHYGVSCQHLQVPIQVRNDSESAPIQPQAVENRLYFVGGIRGNNAVQRFSLAGETVAPTGYNLGGRHSSCSAGFESATMGYVLDIMSDNHVTRVNFLDETVNLLSIAPGQAWDCRAVSQDHKATIFGGFYGGHNAISEFDFALEARVAVSVGAPHGMTYGGTGKSATKAYLSGGGFPQHQRVQAYTFASKTTAAIAAQLPEVRVEQASVGGLDKSLWVGGTGFWTYYTQSIPITSITKLTHSSEAISTLATTFSPSRIGAFGGSSGGNGYVAGGHALGVDFSAINRINLGTEVISTLPATLVFPESFGATLHAQ